MKKLLCICMIMMSCISVFGQASVSNVAIPEPEFNGDAFICNLSANTYVKAEKAIGQMKTKDQFWGPERKLYVKPSKSSVRVKKDISSLSSECPTSTMILIHSSRFPSFPQVQLANFPLLDRMNFQVK